MDRLHNRKVSVACLLFRAGQRIRLGLDVWASELELETDAHMGSIVDSLAQAHKDAKPLIIAARMMQASPPWRPELLQRLTAIVRELGNLVIEPWDDPQSVRTSIAKDWKAANPLQKESAALDTWFDDLYQSWIAEGRSICRECLPSPIPNEEVACFIASSAEGAEVAEAFRDALQLLKPRWKLIFWQDDQSLFDPGKSTLENLEEIIGDCDFGIYVLTPDDQLKIRDESVITPRGNVIFELGMGVGLHRRTRSLIVHDNVHKISDLSGITTLPYTPAPVALPSIGSRLLSPILRLLRIPHRHERGVPAPAECARIASTIVATVQRETEATAEQWKGR